jgi:Flp pilus assembly protein TadB
MSARILALAGVFLWIGITLVLSQFRWFAQRPLTERLRPYRPAGGAPPPSRGLLSVESFRDVVGPLARELGGRLARLFGVDEDLALRLRRVHSTLDPTAFRVRQLGWAGGSFVAATVASIALQAPPLLGALFALIAPLLAFLVLEQQLAHESTRWQQRLFLELPVVCEQIGMLLSAGYSLGAALARVAERGRGACARDLQRVVSRIQQGLTETAALGEWSELEAVPELNQVVHVLTLNRATNDLGRLMAQEARAVRQEVQRRRVELIERRSEQVWIPVTVAALVPGVIFLAVPFIQAMHIFSSS